MMCIEAALYLMTHPDENITLVSPMMRLTMGIKEKIVGMARRLGTTEESVRDRIFVLTYLQYREATRLGQKSLNETFVDHSLLSCPH
jgi:hypothetical protein